jgi:hypothetical protein
MKRRNVLYQVAVLIGSGVLAGCIGGDNTTGETTSAGRTTQLSPTVESRAIETTSTDCLQGTRSPTANQSATIEFNNGTLLVTGEIKSPDPCHEATIESITYDASADALTFVGSVAEKTSEACIQCTGSVKYEARITVSDGLTGRVIVKHRIGSETTIVAQQDM